MSRLTFPQAMLFSIVIAATGAPAWPPQLQLEMHVPFDPTAFPSDGRYHLTYELYLANFDSHPITLRRVEVLDADSPGKQPIAAFEARQLNTFLHHMGKQIVGDEIPPAEDDAQRQLAAGETVVVYLSITLDTGVRIPNRLRHRVLTDDSAVEGATIGTHHDKLRVLGSPLEGAHWLAGSGPSNDSHHRRQILLLNGQPHISSRYAIDWMQVENGSAFSGDERDNRSYHSYGKPVLAVADAKVITVKDGIPENIPGHFGKGSLAVPMSMETLLGNTITLDLGGGQFAYYAHLQPGSLRVKVGDRVRRGQILARIGDTGSSFEPHLHFEVTTGSSALDGEGVPYIIDEYTVTASNGDAPARRTHELPLTRTLVEFGGNAAVSK
jgi:hypothetical protein